MLINRVERFMKEMLNWTVIILIALAATVCTIGPFFIVGHFIRKYW